jgi:hypothetical protein
MSMYRLAQLLENQGNLREAETLMRRAAESGPRVLGKGDWRTGRSLASHGGILTRLGRHEEAERQLLKGYRCLRDCLGPADEWTRSVIPKLVDLYTAWGKDEEAERYRALLTTPR